MKERMMRDRRVRLQVWVLQKVRQSFDCNEGITTRKGGTCGTLGGSIEGLVSSSHVDTAIIVYR